MSAPGSLWHYHEVNGYAVYIWNPVTESNLFQVTFREGDKVLFACQMDFEKVEKIINGEFEIESDYCPIWESDEFKIVYY
jgi:hypothetical protein